MDKEVIIILAFGIATLIMILKWFIGNQLIKAEYVRKVKRTQYIQQLVKEEKIEFKLIDVDAEPKRIERPDNNNGLIIDKVLYDDKNSIVMEMDRRIYIIGKKEDFVIALVGSNIR